MSILANLLKKNEPRQEGGQIPPGLLQTVSLGGSGRDKKRIYLLVAFVSSLALAGGGLLLVYLQTRVPSLPQPSQDVARQVTVPVQAVPAIVPQAQLSSARKTAPLPSQEVVEKKAPKLVNLEKTHKKQFVKTTSAEKQGPAFHLPRKPESNAPQALVKDRATLDAYLFAARGAEARRDYSHSLQLYRKALAIDPQNYRIMNNLASISLSMGLSEQALGYANKALQHKNDYVSALVNGGIAQGRLGNESGARAMLNRAVVADPASRPALYNLALSQERSKAFDEALGVYRRLADAGDPQGVLGMARIREQRGEKSEALRLYRDVTALPEAGQQLRDVARERIDVLDR